LFRASVFASPTEHADILFYGEFLFVTCCVDCFGGADVEAVDAARGIAAFEVLDLYGACEGEGNIQRLVGTFLGTERTINAQIVIDCELPFHLGFTDSSGWSRITRNLDGLRGTDFLTEPTIITVFGVDPDVDGGFEFRRFGGIIFEPVDGDAFRAEEFTESAPSAPIFKNLYGAFRFGIAFGYSSCSGGVFVFDQLGFGFDLEINTNCVPWTNFCTEHAWCTLVLVEDVMSFESGIFEGCRGFIKVSVERVKEAGRVAETTEGALVFIYKYQGRSF
jgi:hypothetical protein